MLHFNGLKGEETVKILVHICCAPCFAYPHKKLTGDGHKVTGFFYNPNIHPYTEYRARLHALQRYTALEPVEVIYRDEYPLEEFIRGQLSAIDNGEKRCRFCYEKRLEEAARFAEEKGFDAFTTTLLESKHQPHEMIKRIGEGQGRKHDIAFFYEDFRVGWKEGILISKDMELYRQKFCGCIFSEKERYTE
jgi:predicted adenine nucleotide alpha hydrolase (AANH) superfamily ATPase